MRKAIAQAYDEAMTETDVVAMAKEIAAEITAERRAAAIAAMQAKA